MVGLTDTQRLCRWVTATAVALFSLWLFTSHAEAATNYSRLGSFGDAATFNTPQRIAVHEATGNVFVVDRGNNRIRVLAPDYDATPPAEPLLAPLTDIGSPSETPAPAAIAIDQDTGDVYVAVTGGSSPGIRKYNQTPGSPPSFSLDPGFISPQQGPGADQVGSFGTGANAAPLAGGLAVDPGNGNLLIADPGKNLIHAIDSAGSPVTVFTGALPPITPNTSTFNGFTSGTNFNGIRDIAVDSQGNITIANSLSNNFRVEKYTRSGAYLGTLTGVPNGQTAVGIVVAADQASDEVFVSSKAQDAASEGRVFQFDGALQPRLDLAAPGSTPGGGLPGIAVDPGDIPSDPGRLYVVTTTSLFSFLAQPAIQVYENLGDLPDPPGLSVDAVEPAEVEATTAILRGSVNPNGASAVRWRFEYRRTDAGPSAPWQEMALSADALSGDQAEPVSATVTDLQPNSAYEIRLYAVNEFDDSARSQAPHPTFTTEVAAPEAETGSAWSIASRSATLEGTVNPRNSGTEYFFEYGIDTDYGSKVPVQPADAGAGGDPVQVVATPRQLEPGTEYHFRLVAINSSGMRDEGDDAVFVTRTSEEVARPERGSEMVSAVDTNGIPANPLIVSDDGEQAVYWTFIPDPHAENGTWAYRRSVRQPDGAWNIDPFSTNFPVDPEARLLGGSGGLLLTADLAIGVSSTGGNYDPDDQNPRDDAVSDAYSRNSVTGEMRWISRASQIPETRGGQVNPVYVSPDGSHIVFETSRQLLPGAAPSGVSVYEWIDGDLRLVSIPPGQTDAIRAQLGSGTGINGVMRNAVSSDGSRIAFQGITGSSLPGLFVRLDGERAVEVAAGASANFWGADTALTTVVYTSTGNLFAFDVDAETGQDLTPSSAVGQVARVLDVSDDANRIYFVAGDSEPSIYLAERTADGSPYDIRLVAPYDLGENVGDATGAYPGIEQPPVFRELSSSPNGGVLAFRSRLELIPGRHTGGKPQVYVYERARDELSCASCPADGSVPSRHANLTGAIPMGGGQTSYMNGQNAHNYQRRPRNVLPDGTVFFQTETQLLPADVNAGIDVYEWRGNELSLISTGRGRGHSAFGDASVDGATVIFRSSDDLVPGDHVAGVLRTYAARAGGGYVPPAREPACQGDECRGPASAPGGLGRSAAIGREGASQPSVSRNCRPAAKRVVRLRRRAARLARAAKRREGSTAAKLSKRRKVTVKKSRRAARQLRACRRARA